MNSTNRATATSCQCTAYWLILPNWISSCLAACFFVAVAITLLVVVLMSVIVIAPV